MTILDGHLDAPDESEAEDVDAFFATMDPEVARSLGGDSMAERVKALQGEPTGDEPLASLDDLPPIEDENSPIEDDEPVEPPAPAPTPPPAPPVPVADENDPWLRVDANGRQVLLTVDERARRDPEFAAQLDALITGRTPAPPVVEPEIPEHIADDPVALELYTEIQELKRARQSDEQERQTQQLIAQQENQNARVASITEQLRGAAGDFMTAHPGVTNEQVKEMINEMGDVINIPALALHPGSARAAFV